MKIKTELKKEYILKVEMDEREASILCALFGLGDLSDHLGKSFAEYKEPSRKLFFELHSKLMANDGNWEEE